MTRTDTRRTGLPRRRANRIRPRASFEKAVEPTGEIDLTAALLRPPQPPLWDLRLAPTLRLLGQAATLVILPSQGRRPVMPTRKWVEFIAPLSGYGRMRVVARVMRTGSLSLSIRVALRIASFFEEHGQDLVRAEFAVAEHDFTASQPAP